MTPGSKPRVSVTAVGPSACWTLAFRAGGQLRVATIVKATFIFVPDRAMLLVEPDAIVAADRRHARAAESSLLAASDLVPWRPRADVTLRGHAKAPQGQTTAVMGVRFMVARGEGMLLDKRLVVQGPPGPMGPAGGPMPIASIPLVYELAAGGPGSPENPVGVAENSGRWPSIVDAQRRPRPVGFGPLSAAWAIRGRLWHAPHDPSGAGIPDFPADFQWEYFNAAPPDQRLPYLYGDEWIGFEGMNSQIPRVQSCLPHAQGVARLYGPEPETRVGKPIRLVADTVTVDTDQLRCWVVWRGAFVVKSEAELDGLHVVAGVETPERPVAFPQAYNVCGVKPSLPHAPQVGLPDTGARAPVSAPAAAGAPVPAPAPRRAALKELAETQSVSGTPESGEPRPATPFGAFGSAPRKKADKRLLAMRVFDPGAGSSAPKAPAQPADETVEPISAVPPSMPFPHRSPPSVFARTAAAEPLSTLAPATPFTRAPGAEAPASAPPAKKPRPKGSATVTLDASSFQQPQEPVLPFAGGAHSHVAPEERSSLPPATPFERASPAPSGPFRPFSPPPPPPAPEVVSAAAPPEPFRAPAETPSGEGMTLGAHFLAAMARSIARPRFIAAQGARR